MRSFSVTLITFNRKLGQSVAWLCLAMVLLMAINVASRYLFSTTMAWQQEAVGFMHALVFLLASAYTLADNEHVRVDVLYQTMPKRVQAWVNLLGCLLLLIPMAAVIAYFSTPFILSSWAIFERSPEYQGIYGIFILKSSIWLFSATMILQATAISAQSVNTIRGQGDHITH